MLRRNGTVTGAIRAKLDHARDASLAAWSMFRGRYQALSDVVAPVRAALRIGDGLIEIDRARLVHIIDFMPDSVTLAGAPLEYWPHLDFVRSYLSDTRRDPTTTEYFRRALAGHLPYPARGAAGATARCVTFQTLIETVRREGYRPDRGHPISVMDDGMGQTMVMDGKHRVAILAALGERRAAVDVIDSFEYAAAFRDVFRRLFPKARYRVTERVWRGLHQPRHALSDDISRLKQRITSRRLETWAHVYHPIPFIEFADLTTQVPSRVSSSRLNMILERVGSVRGATVLDLGCNVGYYALQLAKRGATGTGLDKRADYIELANEVAALYQLPAKFYEAELTPEFLETLAPHYDIALCFSVFQWIAAGLGARKAASFLSALSEKVTHLFFDVAVNSGKACLTAPKGQEKQFVATLLRENTTFSRIEHVGDVEPYRNSVRHVFHCAH